MNAGHTPGTPAWFAIVTVVAALPVFQLPVLLGNCGDGTDLKIWLMLYPVYVVAAAWVAWRSYAVRPVLAWIIIALMLLTHAAIFLMVLFSNNL